MINVIAILGFLILTSFYMFFVYLVLENRKPAFMVKRNPPKNDNRGSDDGDGGDDGISWDDVTLDLPPGVTILPPDGDDPSESKKDEKKWELVEA